MTKEEYELSEAKFLNIRDARESLDDMIQCLKEGREYLQIQFRQEDPSTHVQKLKPFWKLPFGVDLLSHWFEWLVDGSRDGSLLFSIEDHIDAVINLTAKILGKKKGES